MMHPVVSQSKSSLSDRNASLPGAFTRLVVGAVGYFAGLFSFAMIGGAVDQPHPDMGQMAWAQWRAMHAMLLACVFTAAVMLAMFLSVMVDRCYRRPMDLRFYPVAGRFRAMWGTCRSRVVLWAGVLGIVFYLAWTMIEQWRLSQIPHGLLWPPERVFVSVVWLWCIVWLSEAIARPARGAWVAAMLYLVFSLCLGLPLAVGWLVE